MEIRGVGENSHYIFQLPDPPKKKLIHGWEKDKADQFWTRPYNLTDEEFSHLSYEQQSEIVEIEDIRCTQGFWFWNFGEPIYLTGDNYFTLTHGTSEGKHLNFIKHQTLDFYFYDYCEKDDKCFGSVELKPRQEGSTLKKSLIFLNRAIRTPFKHFGIQSKTGDDARNVVFKQISEAFQSLPYFLKPRVKSEGIMSEINFSQPPQRFGRSKSTSTFDSDDAKDKELYLNTKIDWKTTSVNGYDGKHLFMYIEDEYFKWETADAYETLKTVSRAIGDDFELWGKMFLMSTIGTDDKKEKVSEEAIQNGMKIWNGSSTFERDSNGYTSTKLYRWFVAPQHRKRGRALDKYGNVDEAMVLKVLSDKLANEKDPRARITIIRQDPTTVQQALSTMGSSGNTFPNIYERLVERLHYVENYNDLPYEQRASRPQAYRTGRLEWINNERFGKVRFIDDPNGRFNIAYLPTVAGALMDNRVKEIMQDRYAPYSDSPFVVGLDPVEYEEVQYGEGSKPAFHVYLKYNINNPEMSDLYCLEYFGRPDIPIFREDFYKALFFYGAKTNIERQAGQALFENMKANGMKAFIMKRQMSWNAKTDKDKSLGTPTSPRSIQSGLELIENRFSLPNPEVNENEKDNLKYFWFDRSLKQLIEYDINNKTKFDLVSSMIQTEFASQIMKKRKIMELHNQELEDQQEVSRSPTIFDYLAPIHDNGAVITHFQHERNQRRNANY